MKFYFVGLALRRYSFDYAPIHAALASMRAQRVSKRIWLCVVNDSDLLRFEDMSRHLSAADEMLVVEIPEERRWSTRSMAAVFEDSLRDTPLIDARAW